MSFNEIDYVDNIFLSGYIREIEKLISLIIPKEITQIIESYDVSYTFMVSAKISMYHCIVK